MAVDIGRRQFIAALDGAALGSLPAVSATTATLSTASALAATRDAVASA